MTARQISSEITVCQGRGRPGFEREDLDARTLYFVAGLVRGEQDPAAAREDLRPAVSFLSGAVHLRNRSGRTAAGRDPGEPIAA